MASTRSRLFAVIAAVIAPFVLAPVCAASGYQLRLVAQSGDNAPGSLGGHFTAFGWPTINASGQVAFVAFTDGLIAESGMWMSAFDDPQSCDLIIGRDYPVPGSPPEIRFGDFDPSFHHPLLTDAGDVGFSAPLTNMADPATGLFRMVDGSIERVAVQGDPAPGAGAGVTYAAISNLPAFNPSNLMAFAATLTGPGVNAGNDRGYFMNWFGGVQLVVREGNGVPGMPGSTFSPGLLQHPTIDDSGKLGFTSSISGANPLLWSRWQGWPGALDMLVAAGQPTPEGGAFSQSVTLDFWSMSVGTNQIGFHQSMETRVGVADGIWNATGSGVDVYAVQGHIGPLGFYDEFPAGDPGISGDGVVALRARFSWFGLPDDTDTAVLRISPGGAAEVVIREDDPAPGFASGVVFDDVMNAFLSTPIINDAHQVVISTNVRGPGIGAGNNQGVWVVDADGTILPIIREGQFLTLGGQPPRQLASWTIVTGVSEHSGRRPGLNARGDVAIRLVFTNGTAAVVVAQRPDACAADLNDDGIIDASDLALLLGAWGNTGPVGEGGDVDWDGDTNGADLAVLLGAWGPCPE